MAQEWTVRGKKYSVEGPSGMTDEGAQDALAHYLNTRGKETPAGYSVTFMGAPPSAGLSGFYNWLNEGMGELRSQATGAISTGLAGGPSRAAAETGPAPAREMMSEIINPVPGSVPEYLIGMATAGAGAKAMQGGRIAQIGKRVAALTPLGATAQLADAWARERPLLVSAFEGAAQGVVGGLITGGAQALGTPNRHFLRAREAFETLRNDSAFSPNVRTQLPSRHQNPAVAFHDKMAIDMQEAASSNVQRMVNDLVAKFPSEAVTLESLASPSIEGSVLARILPKGADIKWLSRVHPVTGTQYAVPEVSLETAQQIAAQLRQRKKIADAFEVQSEIIGHLDVLQNSAKYAPLMAGQPRVADAYRIAMAQYRHDKVLIDFVKRAHAQQAERFGGANPLDYPGVAKATELVGPVGTRDTGRLLGMGEIAIGAMAPMTPWGRYRMAHGAQLLSQEKGLNVNARKIVPPSATAIRLALPGAVTAGPWAEQSAGNVVKKLEPKKE